MRGVMMYGPGDVRVEERDAPTIVEPTDAIIRLSATCICGSDLWPYRGAEPLNASPQPMGHEYLGVVEQIGADVKNVKVGDFVVGSFVASDNTCEICQAGYQSRCIHNVMMGGIGTQAELARIPLADGTLVATPGHPSPDLIPSLMAASDVLGTGWFGAVAAEAGPGRTIAVVALARAFGATDVIEERGDEGAARVTELTGGYGAHGTVEAVGTQESMWQAIKATRPGGYVGYVGVSHGVELDGLDLFFTGIHLHGGPAPVRQYLPELIQLIWDRTIDPGKVFDLTLPLEDAAEGYRAMDERRATKVLLTI
jgi:threonine dehydrogenase-like Zn-dependent dehydrogenase